ncbi:unnamed protein product [Caenorhabditis brenneri]
MMNTGAINQAEKHINDMLGMFYDDVYCNARLYGKVVIHFNMPTNSMQIGVIKHAEQGIISLYSPAMKLFAILALFLLAFSSPVLAQKCRWHSDCPFACEWGYCSTIRDILPVNSRNNGWRNSGLSGNDGYGELRRYYGLNNYE